jgi:hypothetical protein
MRDFIETLRLSVIEKARIHQEKDAKNNTHAAGNRPNPPA